MHKSFESAESFEHIKPYKQSLRESNEQYQIEPLSGDSQSSNPERRNFKLFLIIFLVVESVIFLSLFSSYFNTPLILEPLSEGILKEADLQIITKLEKGFTVSKNVWDLSFINTLLILFSTRCLKIAFNSYSKMHKNNFFYFLASAIISAMMFIVFQLAIYKNFMEVNFLSTEITLLGSRLGASQVKISNFYIINIFHTLHVLVGAILLMCIAIKSNVLNDDTKEHQPELLGLLCTYWKFIEITWLAIFLILYL